MYSFKQYLSESKNTHLEHLEDEIINNGYEGGLNAVEFLKSLRNMLTGSSRRKLNVSVKWDGAPAVFCGINPENGRFFVGSKSVFNVNPKINYTQADIRKNHAGGLVDKLSVCLKELPKLGIRGVVQGDLLFTPADIKKVSIRGEDAIAFTPNTITYAVPENTDLAKRILRAKLGIIFHTTYNGRKMANLKASFGVNVNRFAKTPSVFYDDASYKDTSGVSTFSSAESDRYDALLRMANGSLQRGKKVLELLKNDAERTYDNYETMLNERYDGSTIDENKKGLARELARMNLTLNSYTQWYWKTDLLNLLNFLFLRADSHAQYEIRVYAEAMLETVKKWVPITHSAFLDYRVGAVHVSAKGKKIIQQMVNGEKISFENSGLSKREWNELMTSFSFEDKIV